MLEVDYQQALADRLSRLRCGVQLPAAIDEFFNRTGHLPSLDGDRRRFVRRHRPGLAVLELCSTLPAVPRNEEPSSVLTKNISRGGLSFLHIGQLYPGEEFILWLPEGKTHCTVIRCQRLGELCYEVAGKFVDAQNN